MAKKCPPGVICIENITIIFLILISVVALYIMYVIFQKQNNLRTNYIINQNHHGYENGQNSGLYVRPSSSFSTIENDVLLNPYEPPLRDNRIVPGQNYSQNYSQNNTNVIKRMPINVPTQSFNSAYRQVGILTRIGAKETALPLLGRPLITNRDKWNFYTLSETNAMLKLPITYKGRKCMDENGCDDLYTGDTVKVEGYHDAFKVTTYDNNNLQYIPYI